MEIKVRVQSEVKVGEGARLLGSIPKGCPEGGELKGEIQGRSQNLGKSLERVRLAWRDRPGQGGGRWSREEGKAWVQTACMGVGYVVPSGSAGEEEEILKSESPPRVGE
jgi:hypothetical protein